MTGYGTGRAMSANRCCSLGRQILLQQYLPKADFPSYGTSHKLRQNSENFLVWCTRRILPAANLQVVLKAPMTAPPKRG